MAQWPPDADELDDEDEAAEPAPVRQIAVIDAHGSFRLLVILVAIWSFIEGFALFTGGIEALSLNADRTAERVVGAQMLVLSPVFGLLAWRREQFRLLLWLPYAAQLAILIPVGMSIVSGSSDGALLFVVSLIFFVLLFYFWWHSHPLEHFAQVLDEDEEDEAEDEQAAAGEEDGAVELPPVRDRARPAPARTPPAARPAEGPRRSTKFRRRDG